MRKRVHSLKIFLFLAAMMLGIREGNLALWVGEDPEPVYIFECRADLLPPADQILLRRGIWVEDTAELVKVLENYL